MDENMIFPLQQQIAETMRGRDGEKRRRLLRASANTLRDTMQIANAHPGNYIAAFRRKACFRALKRL